MVLTLGVMGLTVLNTAPEGFPVSLMSPNPPESLVRKIETRDDLPSLNIAAVIQSETYGQIALHFLSGT
jgi:hypothetical protein